MLRFVLNDAVVETDIHPGTSALDYLRNDAHLTGVKHACREGDCGSCVVLLGRYRARLVDYRVVTSCLLPIGALSGLHVVTVEGLNRRELGPIHRAFADEGASQCGFCTPGFVVSITGYLLEAARWDEHEAIEAVAGNICRCTGYASIRRSLAQVLDRLRSRVDPTEQRIPALVREGFLPDYFLRTDEHLSSLDANASHPPRDASRLVIAGGTDLYVQRPDDLPQTDVVVLPIDNYRPVWSEKEEIYLAATATAEDMKRSDLLQQTVGGIASAMGLMGSLPIRRRATIAGNIVNASPIGDMTIILLALDAEIGLVANDSQRTLALRDFFLDYKDLALRPDELVEWVRFRKPPGGSLFNFEKVSKRTHLDIASVNSAVVLEVRDDCIHRACLSAGGVAPIPMRLLRTAEFLIGRSPDANTALTAAAIARAEVTPISDVRGSAEYKRLLLGQLILAHFNVLLGIEAGLIGEATA
jgi:xanthine dehydrogenase small subunit